MAACLPSPVCLVGRGSQGLGPLPGWPGSPLPGARVGVSCWHWLSVGQVNYPKVADSSSFDEDSSDALSPEQPASHESQGSVPSPLEARVSEPLPSATSVSPTQVSSCPGHWDLLVLPRVVFDLCQVGQGSWGAARVAWSRQLLEPWWWSRRCWQWDFSARLQYHVVPVGWQPRGEIRKPPWPGPRPLRTACFSCVRLFTALCLPFSSPAASATLRAALVNPGVFVHRSPPGSDGVPGVTAPPPPPPPPPVRAEMGTATWRWPRPLEQPERVSSLPPSLPGRVSTPRGRGFRRDASGRAASSAPQPRQRNRGPHCQARPHAH